MDTALKLSGRVYLQEAFKLALSFTLYYWFSLSMGWSMPKYGALAIAVVSTVTAGDSIFKGAMRSMGTIAGAVLGIVVIALFAGDPITLVLAVAVILVGMTYFAQTSRHDYAWFVAVIVFILTWFIGYLNPHGTFHFAFFRSLETVAGVVIYSVVSVVLWPVTAETLLISEGRELWAHLEEYGRGLRRQFAGGGDAIRLTEARRQVAGSLMQLEHTLPSVYADSWATVSRKPVWECLRTSLRSLVENLDHLKLILDDVREIDTRRVLPNLDRALDTIAARLDLFGALWNGDHPEGDTRDTALLDPMPLEVDGAVELTHSNRAVVTLVVEAFASVDRASREVLRSLRALADLDPVEDFVCRTEPSQLRRPSLWSLGRLLNSLQPAICWLIASTLWIAIDVPVGPAVGLLAAVLAFATILHPMDLLNVLKWLLVAIWFVIAPVYLIVLPRVDSMTGLLVVIFVFAFFSAWAGQKWPYLRLAALAMFALLIDISDHQEFSMMKVVVVTMIVTLGIVIPFLTAKLLNPLHPASNLRRELRRFFAACARVIRGFEVAVTADEKGRRLRKAAFEDEILTAPHRMQEIAQALSASDNSRDATVDLESLVESAEVLTLRLEALDYTHRLAFDNDDKIADLIEGATDGLAPRFRGIFDRWSSSPQDESEELQALESEFLRRIEALKEVADAQSASWEDLRKFHLHTGSVRGLLSSMNAVNQAYVPVGEILNASTE